MVRIKYRIRFRKTGELRLVSHHDLMRCLERMLRRAELPIRSTEGFNPRPKMTFALSLGLGIEGCAEIVELEMNEELPAEEVQARLARQAPVGFEIVSCQRIDAKRSVQVRQLKYRVAVPAERRAELPERIGRLLSEEHCWVDRTRPRPKRLDLRPSLCRLAVEADALEMDLAVVPAGTARPDEILTLLGLEDLLEQGAVLQRTNLILEEE